MTLTPEQLDQMIHDAREEARQDHERMRDDYDSLNTRTKALETAREGVDRHLDRIDGQLARPVEISTLRFTPQMFVAGIAICVTIIGSAYWLRGTVQDLSAQLASGTKIQDERMGGLKQTLDAVQRMQQLQQYDIQRLNETVLKGRHP